jgi:PBSX family phage terminase large subunit
MMLPTQKQLEAINGIINNKNVILTGGARAGKTYSILFAMPWLIEEHKEQNIVLGAKTLANVERNILAPLRDIYGAKYIGQIKDKKDVVVFGKLCWCIPFVDESSQNRLQGTSIGLAILDEIVLCPKSYYMMLRTRLDKPNSQLLATCNPGNANHYIKTDLIDNKDITSKFVQHWTLYDNREHLSEEVIKDFEAQFKKSPTFYKRMILGQWCSSEGLACFGFDEAVHYRKLEDIDIKSFLKNAVSFVIGIDGATNNDKTCAVPILFDNEDNSLIFKEFVHNPKTSKRLSNIEQIKLFKQYLNELMNDSRFNLRDLNVDKVMVVDCASADLIIQLRLEFGNDWIIIPFTKKDTKQTLEIMNNVFTNNMCILLDYQDGVYDYELKEQTSENVLLNELQTVRVFDTLNKDYDDESLDARGVVVLNPRDPNDAFDSLRYALAYYYKRQEY